MSKKQNEIKWERFEAALKGSKDMATNGGFRQTLGDGRWATHQTNRISPLVYISWRKSGIWRDNQQLFNCLLCSLYIYKHVSLTYSLRARLIRTPRLWQDPFGVRINRVPLYTFVLSSARWADRSSRVTSVFPLTVSQ